MLHAQEPPLQAVTPGKLRHPGPIVNVGGSRAGVRRLGHAAHARYELGRNNLCAGGVPIHLLVRWQ